MPVEQRWPRLRRRLASLRDRLSRASLPTRAVSNPPVDELPKAWLSDEEDALVPPRRLWLGPRDSISHYYRGVWEYLAYLQLLGELRRESAVLELGCGHGRTAHGLLQYLRHPGQYRGLDVDRRSLEEARSRIQSGHPIFQFLWADVYNRHYNPSSTVRAESFVFPLEVASFDVIYAASLFTHLLPDEAQNYLRESGRVLRRDGRCLFSFCRLDYSRGPGTAISPAYEVEHALPGHAGVAVRDLTSPDNLIAYSQGNVHALAERAGLRVVRVIPGLWSNSPGWAVHEQDLVLFGPRDAPSSREP